jgi:hypothetical protein
MGYGLVALPRQLWSLGNPSEKLKTLYPQAVSRDEARKSTQYELQGAITEAQKELEDRDEALVEQDASVSRAYTTLHSAKEKAEAVLLQLDGKTSNARGFSSSPSAMQPDRGGTRSLLPHSNGAATHTFTNQSNRDEVLGRLVKVHSALKINVLEARRAVCRYEQLVQNCLRYEELEEDESTHVTSAVELLNDIPSDGCWGRSRHALCHNRCMRASRKRLRSFWVKTLRDMIYRYSAIACGTLSAVIVVGQMTMFWTNVNLSILSYFFQTDLGVFWTQLLCVLPLSYMAVTHIGAFFG